MPSIIALLIYLVIFCIVVGLCYWLITSFLPPPIQKWALALMYVVVAIIIIYMLLSMVGGGSIKIPPLR